MQSKAIPEDEAEHLLEEDDKQKNDLRVSKNNVQLHHALDEGADDDEGGDVMDDKEVLMNHRVKGAANLDIDGTNPKFKSTEDMRLEIEKMSKKLEEETKGQGVTSSEDDGRSSGMESVAMVDSDDDD